MQLARKSSPALFMMIMVMEFSWIISTFQSYSLSLRRSIRVIYFPTAIATFARFKCSPNGPWSERRQTSHFKSVFPASNVMFSSSSSSSACNHARWCNKAHWCKMYVCGLLAARRKQAAVIILLIIITLCLQLLSWPTKWNIFSCLHLAFWFKAMRAVSLAYSQELWSMILIRCLWQANDGRHRPTEGWFALNLAVGVDYIWIWIKKCTCFGQAYTTTNPSNYCHN